LSTTPDWKPTACVLCSENCGIEVQVQDGHLHRIKGDRKHPTSAGYLCDKASRLDFYQNNPDRLTQPLRRTPTGGFEAVPWDTAIAEIAERLNALKASHGPGSIAFYGAAGQGNHLALPYAVGLRLALGTPYFYHALGQEKTGEFWLDGKLFGSQACHTSRDIEHTDYVVFSGTNPWHAHGFPRARKILHEFSKEPGKTMVVIDPRRTETAKLADIHLQLRPGTDAFVFAAILGTIVQEGLEDRAFLDKRTVGFEEVRPRLKTVPVEAYAKHADVDVELVRKVARGFAKAKRACVRSDLGLQQSFHSTLNLYLEKLLYLITGHFGNEGGNSIHAQTVPLLWHSDENHPAWEQLKTRVTRMIPIAGFYPPNILPAEIDSTHPERTRAVLVDSANPVVTGADSQAYEKAFRTLELLVVIDKDMTETAELAHYVLPAPSQFERHDCTFFNWGFPVNHLHLRHPILPRPAGTLPEQQIYRRLARAIGADLTQNPLLGPLEQILAMPQMQALPEDLRVASAPLLMIGMGFVEQHKEAVLRAGIKDEGEGLAVAWYKRIVGSPSGTEISVHEYEDAFSFIKHADGKIHLPIGSMLEELSGLQAEAAGGAAVDTAYPFMLSAGERRSSNATTNYRHEDWRAVDKDGALRIHAHDAKTLGVANGDELLCESRAGRIRVRAQIDDTVRPGCLSLPHGFGLKTTTKSGKRVPIGPLINALSSSDHCDPLTKTPYHKNIPVRLAKV
jgi:anaerobic selenocysteine-containing dehydrogenase